MKRHTPYAVIATVLMCGLALAAETSTAPQPGQPLTIQFPALPTTLFEMSKNKATVPSMTIFLPKNYDPKRKHPLLIFLNGGDGGPATSAAIARKLTQETDFVCAELPLFREKADPPPLIGLRDNDFTFMWPHFKTMLARLDELVPNIDPAHRVIGGFSNGAHTTAGMIDFVGDEFVNYFSAYLFVEGGARLQHFERIKDRPVLVLFGGARNRDWETSVGKPARDAGVKVTFHKMENVGHAFPDAQYPVVREWLHDVTR